MCTATVLWSLTARSHLSRMTCAVREFSAGGYLLTVELEGGEQWSELHPRAEDAMRRASCFCANLLVHRLSPSVRLEPFARSELDKICSPS